MRTSSGTRKKIMKYIKKKRINETTIANKIEDRLLFPISSLKLVLVIRISLLQDFVLLQELLRKRVLFYLQQTICQGLL